MEISTVLSSIYVKELQLCVDWYANFLGREHDRVPQESCREWEIVKNFYLQVLVHPEGPSSSSVAFIVASLDRETQALSMRGIEVEKFEEYSGFVKTAVFKDPEGNIVTLVETISEA